jgi:hypothetical protein
MRMGWLGCLPVEQRGGILGASPPVKTSSRGLRSSRQARSSLRCVRSMSRATRSRSDPWAVMTLCRHPCRLAGEAMVVCPRRSPVAPRAELGK